MMNFVFKNDEVVLNDEVCIQNDELNANAQEFVYMLQDEKRALGHGPAASRLIPWLTVDTSGPTSPTACFDELVHVFLNGASGFSYYADLDFHDMEYYINIAAVMALMTPFEDLIIDGQLAPFVSSVNCIRICIQNDECFYI